MTYKVVEIFHSIEGESKNSGLPSFFIRLAGCNLRCAFCDTTYAQTDEEAAPLTIGQILEQLSSAPLPRITITGGEPLIADGIEQLVQTLLEKGFEVNIETSGAVDIAAFLAKLPDRSGLFFTIDYKLPSGGETAKMLYENYLTINADDCIKLVVGSDGDLKEAVSFVKQWRQDWRARHGETPPPRIYMGVVHGAYDYKKLAAALVTFPALKDARLQVQLHKVIWEPSTRGV